MWLVFLIGFSLLPSTRSSDTGRLGCTALAIDGFASVDGAAYAVENTDCNMCDFRLTYVPPRIHEEGDKRPVYLNQPNYPRFVGYGRGSFYHPKDGEAVREPVGFIPQVAKTYGYYESVNPLMNDAGLGVGESSCGASLQNKPPGSTENRSAPTGILDAMTMLQLALERCATALCAVETLGDLAETYGYLPYVGEPTEGKLDGRPIFADSGESFTIADATGEAWVLNLVGGVEGVVRSVWAAQRVPKGHMAVIANEFTMGDLPLKPSGEFRFCKQIHQAAISAGLWDGRGALNFKKVFAPSDMRYQTGSGPDLTPPVPIYTSLRQWRLLSLVAPSMNLTFHISHWDLPFSVKVEKPLSHRDVMELMKDHYGGTEFDMTAGVLAGPFGNPFRLEGGPATLGEVPRGVFLLRTVFSTITQTGPAGSTLWYAPDTPATSVFIPLDSRVANSVSHPFQIGHHREFDRSSSWWAFNFVCNWMQINYKGMSAEDVIPRTKAWQDRFDERLRQIRGANVAVLRSWQMKMQEELTADWWKLADTLVMKWNDGSRTDATSEDKAVMYPKWWAEMIGYSHDIRPIWVQPIGAPLVEVPNYVAPMSLLPRAWDDHKKTWINYSIAYRDPVDLTGCDDTRQWRLLLVFVGFVSTNALAFWLGRSMSRSAPYSKPLLA